MPIAGDQTLAARPNQFELVKNPAGARMFRMLAMASPLVPIAFAVGAYFYGNLLIAVIALLFAVGSPLCMLWLASRSRSWRMTDRRPLHHVTFFLKISEDVDEVRRRVASRDATTYTPLKLLSQATSVNYAGGSVQALWPDYERVTFVVVSAKNHHGPQPPEIIELRDDQHDTFHAALDQGLDQPYRPERRWI